MIYLFVANAQRLDGTDTYELCLHYLEVDQDDPFIICVHTDPHTCNAVGNHLRNMLAKCGSAVDWTPW